MDQPPDEAGFSTSTRVLAGDDGSRYGPVAISLHWATAVLVIVQFGLAETWDAFSRPAREQMQGLHMSFGILLAAVIVARLAWRLVPGHHVPSIEVGWVKYASRTVHYLLYLLLAAVVILGFLTAWSDREGLHFFGLPIPSPFSGLGRAAHHQFHEVHNWVAWAIIIVALGHALAALYHHYVLRDRVLVRMLPGSGGGRS